MIAVCEDLIGRGCAKVNISTALKIILEKADEQGIALIGETAEQLVRGEAPEVQQLGRVGQILGGPGRQHVVVQAQ